MERSRKELHGKRKHRNKHKHRSWLLLSAAALVCTAGIYIWNGVNDEGNENAAEPPLSSNHASQTPSPTPSSTIQAALPSAGDGSLAPSAGSGSPKASPTPTGATDSGAGTVPVQSAVSPDDPDAVTMAFVGDVIFASTVENVLKKNGYDYPYQEVRSYLQRPDITIANLETPITERGEEQKKEYTYRSSPAALPPFVEAGFDVVNLANNHILDFGTVGLLDTLKYLDEAGIKHTGAGKDLEDAYKLAVVERKGLRIAFLGLSRVVPENSWKAGKGQPGTTQVYDPTLAVETIKKARSEADILIVIPHWGVERKDTPEPYQRDLAKRFIDAGADLIVGGHPHVLQGFEMYKGKWIAYSLGNFIFTTNTFAPSWETIILEAACAKGKGCSLNAVPLWNQAAKPVPMVEAEGSKLFERLSGISYYAKVDAGGQVQASASVGAAAAGAAAGISPGPSMGVKPSASLKPPASPAMNGATAPKPTATPSQSAASKPTVTPKR